MAERLPVYDNHYIRDTRDGRWCCATPSHRNDPGRSYSEIVRRSIVDSNVSDFAPWRHRAPNLDRIPNPRIKSRCRQRRRRQGCGWQTRDRETLPSRAAEKGGARHPPDVSNATRPGWFPTATLYLLLSLVLQGRLDTPCDSRSANRTRLEFSLVLQGRLDTPCDSRSANRTRLESRLARVPAR